MNTVTSTQTIVEQEVSNQNGSHENVSEQTAPTRNETGTLLSSTVMDMEEGRLSREEAAEARRRIGRTYKRRIRCFNLGMWLIMSAGFFVLMMAVHKSYNAKLQSGK
ncbi:uncharacterized protein NEMAJ01_0755 [Nematocida major]|uniref:uncharacterized protein n=1 Tax=Nematocida major TaxID=1912982 RepID=UPI002007859D|nr:uncharacterized protein NEMAJ01_0755 [Nematocida major]KAH9385859.1 hypothetical protein NEMAJ01_0755 [Nematocida major]